MADFCAVMLGECCSGFYLPFHRYDLFPVQHELKRRLPEYHVALIALANNEIRFPEENDIDYFLLEEEFSWEHDFLGSPYTRTFAAYIIERSWMRFQIQKGKMSIVRLTYTGRLRHENVEDDDDEDDSTTMETLDGGAAVYPFPAIEEELEELTITSTKNESSTVLGKRRSSSQVVREGYTPTQLYRMLKLN